MTFDRAWRTAAALAAVALAGCSSTGGSGYVAPSGRKPTAQTAAPRVRR